MIKNHKINWWYLWFFRSSVIMAPNLFGTSASLFLEASQQNLIQEKSTTDKTSTPKLETQKSLRSKSKYKWKIVWRNVIAFLYLHISAVYGLYLCFTGAKLITVIYSKSFNSNFSLHRLALIFKRSLLSIWWWYYEYNNKSSLLSWATIHYDFYLLSNIIDINYIKKWEIFLINWTIQHSFFFSVFHRFSCSFRCYSWCS